MDYAKSKAAIAEQAALYIQKYKKYAWFHEPASLYELDTLKLLQVRKITTFEPLKEFTSLKKLEFGTTDSSMTIPDLAGLEAAASLEHLSFISKSTIKNNIEALSRLENLQSLQLFYVRHTLPDQLLAPLKSLKSVSFSKNNYDSQTILPDSLETVSMSFDEIANLPAFAPHKGVKQVSLGGQTCQLENLDSFRVFPEVEEIRLIAPKKLADLSYAAELRKLRVLDANFAAAADVSPFFQHEGIEEIRLRGSSVEQVHDMGVCPNLKTLYLEKSRLKSIDGIREQFPQLELLWIWETLVKDLEPLTGMHRLKNLDLTKLKPKSWDFISTLTGLEVLDLCKTSFSDPGQLLKLPRLKKLRLSGSNADPQSGVYKELEDAILNRNGELIH
ncbi:leucine-rich repeat domain-containing protein [Paenibacillus camerounensis]|uniref:leucine-rich repeat domain-containing protein n=1 Tax=Paenibacillus camerounensis TaxID=1243663 RepID=UPI0005A97453|nr:leucine-rich repeat domain-containing protein [Paenibacillus camerounensis]